MNPEQYQKQIISQLQDDGMCRIVYLADLKGKVAAYVSKWKAFCELPEDIRKRFPYFNGVGYELKDNARAVKGPNSNRVDHKEDLHIQLENGTGLLDVASHTDRLAQSLVLAGLELIPLLETCVLQFASVVESGFNIPGFIDEVRKGKEKWWLRSLHYFGDRNVGDEIASAHVDKSGFTLHLYESDPGLEFLDITTKSWVPAPVMDTETVLFPGMQTQLRTQGSIKALCHRVVATDVTANKGRFSVVCFIPLPDTARYNKEAAGRLQEQAPGFNYGLGHDEFSKFFTN